MGEMAKQIEISGNVQADESLKRRNGRKQNGISVSLSLATALATFKSSKSLLTKREKLDRKEGSETACIEMKLLR
jgi:hypothetical protein